MQKTIYFDYIIKENIKKNYRNWPQIADASIQNITIQGCGSGKTNALFKLICRQPDIDKIYLYPKDSYEAKYQLLVNKHEGVGLEEQNAYKACIEYSDDTSNIHENIEEYNPDNGGKVLIAVDDIIAGMLSNKRIINSN